MKIGDTNRIKAADLADGSTLYRINNAGGVPYSIIEDADGFESMSCERKCERSMLKSNGVKVVKSYTQNKATTDGLLDLAKVDTMSEMYQDEL